MLPIPEVTRADMAFGNIKHLPKPEAIPAEYWDDNAASTACQVIFFKGGSFAEHGYKPRPGVEAGQATAAIGCILASFEPKHEHKIAGAGYLLDQWFEKEK